MSRPRVLLIAEAANPEWVSVPLVGWSHARALAGVADVHLVTQVRNAAAIRRAGLAEDRFTAIDSEHVARRLHRAGKVVRGGAGKGWTAVTAMATLAYYEFERLVWKRFGEAIGRGAFDVVHRLTPLSPTSVSLIAARCVRAGVPFVLGPLNGGLPWPREFGAARRAEREWLSYVRWAHRLLPGHGATWRHAAAIIVASRATLEQVPREQRGKCVYIPENGVDPARLGAPAERATPPPVRVAFLGRLVPYKGADMLVEAAAPLVRDGVVEVDVLGDGPEMPRLRALVEREGVGGGVRLHGWVPHKDVGDRLAGAHVLALPSVREFGGGVVLEAMALGVAPVVVDYGGPGELVTASTGFKVPLGSREEIVAGLGGVLRGIVSDPGVIGPMAAAARRRALGLFAWPVKAAQTLEVYRWVLGHRAAKPDFGMPFPEMAAAELCEAAS